MPPESGEDSGGFIKPFLEHLEDLRWMLVKMTVTLVIAMLLSFFFARELLQVVIWPLQRVTMDPKEYLWTMEVTGGFMLAMKLSLYTGLILACPLLLYFLTDFLLPALTRKEQRLLAPVFAAGVGLFLAGVALAYFAVIPSGLRFFIEYNSYLGIQSRWTVDNYVSFVSTMCLAFGVCFELPLVVLALAKLGVVTSRFLRDKRSYIVVIIMVVAALVTPTTDPFNMAMLAVPMYLLFEACIWIAWWMERKEAAAR
jgi:sec-independent protein translocase protein TatC